MNIIKILILSITICCAEAEFKPRRKLNVGTVLFRSVDLDKKRWNSNMMNLLRARRYFENIIPSPDTVDTLNEEYLDYLLEYFKDSYDTIKREVPNPLTRNVMKSALSDVIGGHLQVWIQPISKYSYYGGTISLDNALKVNEIYDAIKHDLKTDGKGWKMPTGNLLRNVPINIATIATYDAFSKAQDHNCDELTYYEKSNSGFTLPLPLVNWNVYPSTMFIPLKNHSLIQLNSVNSSTAVIKYYNLIQSCVNSISTWRNFNERFQTWLVEDVVPHLDDDNLYIPFGGVLSLVNKTRLYRGKYYKTIKGYDFPEQNQSHSFYERLNISGKRLILVLILLIEIIWCVPTLLFILFCKKGNRKSPWGILLCFKAGQNKNKYYVNSNSDTDNENDRKGKDNDQCLNVNSFKNFDNIHSSINENRNVQEIKDEKYFNALSHHEIPCDSEKVPSESKPLLQSTANSKVRPSHHSHHSHHPQHSHHSHHPQHSLHSQNFQHSQHSQHSQISQHSQQSHQSHNKTEVEHKSKETVQEADSRYANIEKDKSKNSTHAKTIEKVIQNFTYSQFQLQEPPATKPVINSSHEKKSSNKDVKNKSSVAQKPAQRSEQSRKLEKTSTTGSKEKPAAVTPVNNKMKKNISPRKQWPNKNSVDIPNAEDKNKPIKLKKKEKEAYKLRKKNLDYKKDEIKFTDQTGTEILNRDMKTLLQIDIEQPTAVINLGISTNREHVKNNSKPSKIPRWSSKTTSITDSYTTKLVADKTNKVSLDDSIIETKKSSHSKLNVTL